MLRDTARRRLRVIWDCSIPRVETGAVAETAGQPMDNEAFAGFYERSASSLWAYLARTSGNPALADDLMQEVYLRFLGASHRADGEVACRRYLFRIATNLMRDHWRRPQTSSMDELPETMFAVGDGSAASDAQAMLGPALAQMRPRDRQLLWLAYAEDYTHNEIAEITGLKSASIRLLLFRARRKLARLLRRKERSAEEGWA
jgi:RNA polymerase sigma-70 factor (ECF subfamily)